MTDTELEIKIRIADIAIEEWQTLDNLNEKSSERLFDLQQESVKLVKELLERKKKHEQ